MIFRKLWPAFAWALFILILTGTPGKYIPSVTSFWDWLAPDKIVHVGVFATLSFLILFGLREQYFVSNRRYLFVISAVGLSLAYGLLTEVLQAYVFIGRDGNYFDFYADGIGAFAGWLAFNVVCRKKIKLNAQPKRD